MSQPQVVLLILTMTLGTQLLRFLPFILFAGSQHTPAWLAYLGRVLPAAIISFLVVYCLRNVSVATRPHGIPELVAILLVVALQVWKKNTLLSIGCGTALYMFLLQVVF
ncbi:MAG: branched-chain amino acid transporter AzlD [Ruminococcaceae bacterium]|jgi:branched-subunit amino acid transport protein AzlD|nr:branched-chain amino acid transporter AzlD [Oscillospiraceae bacterium]